MKTISIAQNQQQIINGKTQLGTSTTFKLAASSNNVLPSNTTPLVVQPLPPVQLSTSPKLAKKAVNQPNNYNINSINNNVNKRKNGKHLVLDLDETLVHTFAPDDNFHSFMNDLTPEQKKRVYKIEFPGGEILWGYIRPGLEEFLRIAFEEFESVAVWSAGTEFYVHEIVKLLFKQQPPKFIMSRNDCNELKIARATPESSHACRFKPLEIIYKRYPDHNESNTIIADDRKDICKLNCINNVQIPEFMVNSKNYDIILDDTSLTTLAKWFQSKEFHDAPDVRTLKSLSPFRI